MLGFSRNSERHKSLLYVSDGVLKTRIRIDVHVQGAMSSTFRLMRSRVTMTIRPIAASTVVKNTVVQRLN